MTDQKKALGKGLSSLIPSSRKISLEDGVSKKYFECPLEDIIPNPEQPRKLFAKETLDELAASIEEKGLIQPLIVRSLGGGKYELIAGERRYRAAKQVGLETAPVVVKETDGSETLELALIENIQREDLNPIEEALAYKELLSKHQFTQDELAKQLGKDRSSIANSLRLLKLPDKIRDFLINNMISMGHARALLSIDNKELQIQIAEDIVTNNLSVRDVEILTRRLKDDASNVHQLPVKNDNNEPSKDFSSLIQKLESHLRKKILVKYKNGKGQLIIAFKEDSELERLADRLLASDSTTEEDV